MAQHRHSASAQRRIPYAAEAIFSLLANPVRQPEWLIDPALGYHVEVTVRHAAGPLRGMGARYLRLKEVPGRSDMDRFETNQFEEPWLVGYSDGIAFELERDGDGGGVGATVVTCRQEKSLGSSMGRIVRKMLRSEPEMADDKDLAGLLARVESVVARDVDDEPGEASVS